MPRGRLRANYCVISKLSFTNVLPVSLDALLLFLRHTPNGDAAKMDFATPPFFFDVLFLRK